MALIRNIVIEEKEIVDCYSRVAIDNDGIVKLFTYKNKDERKNENPLLIEYFDDLDNNIELSKLYKVLKNIEYFNTLKDC